MATAALCTGAGARDPIDLAKESMLKSLFVWLRSSSSARVCKQDCSSMAAVGFGPIAVMVSISKNDNFLAVSGLSTQLQPFRN